MKETSGKNKKVYIIITAVIVIAAVCFILFGIPYIQRHFSEVKVNEAEAVNGEKIKLSSENILIVYFTRVGNSDFEEDVDAVSSASLMTDNGRLIGNSELLAKMVQSSVGGDIYAITTEKKYPSSYSDTINEASKENKEDGLLPLAGELPDMSKYDTVFIVYPLWWGTIPKAVDSFVQQADISSKTVYVIVTHGGSGIAGSDKDLEKASGAKISGTVLSVYDKDAATALPQVTQWLKELEE